MDILDEDGGNWAQKSTLSQGWQSVCRVDWWMEVREWLNKVADLLDVAWFFKRMVSLGAVSLLQLLLKFNNGSRHLQCRLVDGSNVSMI